ncbi:hypothetical protein FOL47_008617 [Perkinsus chesapeaki]|uniref:Protein arginine methyltransferase 10 n=1 Tax=Perkinsus chesapeaki TaxID=330153 RepID=A0A7J6LCU9_PERCH|nr:hypothetical protein FOL47_008617 [Perkinsus chesapeaki]
MKPAVVIVMLIIVPEAAGHTWVFKLKGDIKGGLPRLGETTHDHPDEYYARPICPSPLDLSKCRDPLPPYKPLNTSSQRPCRKAGSEGASNTDNRAEVTRGGTLHISWMGNGHTNYQSDGTCVQIKIAPYKADPSFDDFTTLEECHPFYNKTDPADCSSADITIPRHLTPAIYTVYHMWQFKVRYGMQTSAMFAARYDSQDALVDFTICSMSLHSNTTFEMTVTGKLSR